MGLGERRHDVLGRAVLEGCEQAVDAVEPVADAFQVFVEVVAVVAEPVLERNGTGSALKN